MLGRTNRNLPNTISLSPNVGSPLSAGDVTGDGKHDLFSPGAMSVEYQAGGALGNLYMNEGGDQLKMAGSPPNTGLLIADLNGDGLADLIGSDGVNILIWAGTGDPNFGSSTPIVIAPSAAGGFTPNLLQVADMDGDGRPDLVMPGVILYNQGNFSFTAVEVTFPYTNSPFVIADFNHDGLLDIAMGAFTLLGQTGRTFSQVTPNGLNLTNGLFTAAGDFNQDGFPDVVYGGNGSPMVVSYGRGDGTFYEQSALNVGPISDFSQSLAVADVNGDGRPDIVACLFISEQCVVYTNDGTGGFQVSYLASGTASVNLLVADLNEDGKPVLAITNYPTLFSPPNQVVVWPE
jgi:hypothetical protein